MEDTIKAEIQSANKTETPRKKSNRFVKIPREIIHDARITAATTYIYNVLVDMEDYKTHTLEATQSAQS